MMLFTAASSSPNGFWPVSSSNSMMPAAKTSARRSTVRRSPVEVGDNVTLGESVVAIVEPEQPQFLDARSRREAQAIAAAAEAAVALARAELKRRQAELSYWRNELQRARELAPGCCPG